MPPEKLYETICLICTGILLCSSSLSLGNSSSVNLKFNNKYIGLETEKSKLIKKGKIGRQIFNELTQSGKLSKDQLLLGQEMQQHYH